MPLARYPTNKAGRLGPPEALALAWAGMPKTSFSKNSGTFNMAFCLSVRFAQYN